MVEAAGGLVCFGIAAVVMIAIAVALWTWRSVQRRREALVRLAASAGLRFSDNDPVDVGIPGCYAGCAALSKGHSPRAYNVIFGSFRGREIFAFDFSYKTTVKARNGEREKFHYLSGAIVPCDCRFPGLLIRPEGLLDKVAGAVGAQDINFESREFSRRFFVQSPDRRFAYAAITAPVMEFLLRSDEGWHIELFKTNAAITTGKVWKPGQFGLAMLALSGFLDRIPRYVWKDLGSQREIAAEPADGTAEPPSHSDKNAVN
jgi:hypothetical protein